MSKVNPIKDSYDNGECPDCGLEIPNTVEDGDSCTNCGHVFYGEIIINNTEQQTDVTQTAGTP